MEYTTEVIDRRSGELVTVSLGEWKTVTELAADYDTGPNEFRHVLMTMGLLQSEGRQGRRRLTYEAVALGYGKRIEPKANSKFKHPFDTISPTGQRHIAEQWNRCVEEVETVKASSPDRQLAADALKAFSQSRSSTMHPQMMVCWLLDHFRCLTNQDIAAIISCSRQLVDRYAGQRSRDIARAKANFIATVEAANPALGRTILHKHATGRKTTAPAAALRRAAPLNPHWSETHADSQSAWVSYRSMEPSWQS